MSKTLAAIVLLSSSGCYGAGLVAEPLREAPASRAPEMTSSGPPTGALDIREGADAIWVVGNDHSLFSRSLETQRVARHLVGEDVVAIHAASTGEVWALTEDETTDDLRLWQYAAGTWKPFLQWMGSGDTPLAVTERDGAAVVVTPHAVFVQQGDDLSGAELEAPLDDVEKARTAVTTSGIVFIGSASSSVLHAFDPVSGAARDIVCDPNGCPSAEYLRRDPSTDNCVVGMQWRDAGFGLVRGCDGPPRPRVAMR